MQLRVVDYFTVFLRRAAQNWHRQERGKPMAGLGIELPEAASAATFQRLVHGGDEETLFQNSRVWSGLVAQASVVCHQTNPGKHVRHDLFVVRVHNGAAPAFSGTGNSFGSPVIPRFLHPSLLYLTY